ncbi:MAG: sugar-binding domain-containing protein, partial [Alphaproteobacteria bacterium]
LARVRRAGGAGEILGHFFDARGRPVDTDVSRRTLSLTVEELRGRNIVAIAGGAAKVDALRAVLASGLARGLITDERTAGALAGGR